MRKLFIFLVCFVVCVFADVDIKKDTTYFRQSILINENIIPTINSTSWLGSSAKKYLGAYIDTLHVTTYIWDSVMHFDKLGCDTFNTYLHFIGVSRPAGSYSYMIDASDQAAGFFSGGLNEKTYIYNTEARRLAADTMSGDSRDVMFKGVYRNYAINDASSNAHGIGTSVRNESGGTMATMKGGEFGVNNKGGATNTNMYGATITCENYGTLSDLLTGLKIDLRNEGAVATNEYGLHLTNSNNSVASEVDAAIYVDDAGVNIGWTYGLDLSGATIGTADIKLENDGLISNPHTDTIKFTEANAVFTGKVHVATSARGTASYSYMVDASDAAAGFFSGGASQKTYIYNTEARRLVGDVMSGDSRDVMFKGVYRNYAPNHATQSYVEGIGVSVRNESGGHFYRMIGGEHGTNTKGGATTTNQYGLVTTCENYGTVSDRFIGHQINMRNEGTVATTEYGIELINNNNSVASEIDAGILIGDTGANNGWTYGIDLNGATIGTADFRLENAGLISNPHADTLKFTEAIIDMTGKVVLEGSGSATDYFAGLIYGDLGTAKSVNASTGPSHVIPIQVSIENIANPASAKTIAAGYFKASSATAAQGNAQICGILPRTTIAQDVSSSYGLQSHSDRSGDADATSEFCAGSFKLDVGSGAQMSGENWTFQAILDGSAAKSSSNSTGVGRFQLYSNANADYVVHIQDATGSAVSDALYISHHGTLTNSIQVNNSSATVSGDVIDVLGTFGGYGIDFNGAVLSTGDMRLQNAEAISNLTNGVITIGGAVGVPIAITAPNGPTGFASMFVDTVGTDSLVIILPGGTRRGIAIE